MIPKWNGTANSTSQLSVALSAHPYGLRLRIFIVPNLTNAKEQHQGFQRGPPP